MRKTLLLLLLASGCVSVKSVDGTCAARSLALMSSGTASCGLLNGIETGSVTGLDIGSLAAMVAAYQKNNPMPIPMATPAPTATPAPKVVIPFPDDSDSDFAPQKLPPTSIHAL